MNKKTKKTKEVMRMRKTILSLFLIVLAGAFVYGNADAIQGECSNCHTMHNSQNGAPEAQDFQGNALPAQGQLLKSDCIGCHTASTGQVSTFSAPAVLHTTAPGGQGGGQTLAGGNFYWVNFDETGNAELGHNVSDLPGVDPIANDTNMPDLSPPGWDPVATSSGFAFGQVANADPVWTSKLTCAGTYGCHGDHNNPGSFGGIQGAHHNNPGTPNTATQANVADTVGNSYRFLGGIKGLENADWNWTETDANHNEYFGADNTAARNAGGLAAYGSRDTISFLCAECHGLFHSSIDEDAASGSPWVRHPTDIMLPNVSEYANYNPDNANVYSVEAPVARPAPVPATSSPNVNPGVDAVVMCLSCHRAHGSPEPDLLRWTYNTMIAGGGGPHDGCFVCHTGKN